MELTSTRTIKSEEGVYLGGHDQNEEERMFEMTTKSQVGILVKGVGDTVQV